MGKFIVEWYGTDWEVMSELEGFVTLQEIETGKVAFVTIEYFLRNLDEGA